MSNFESRQLAEQYFEIARKKLGEGNKLAAQNNFNMARAIAVENGMYGLISLIDSYLQKLRN